jgi:hypothetical protein
MSDLEDYGWAAYWSDGYPSPFILVHTVSTTRREACEKVGEVWALHGQTPMQGWKRAYRNGCRCIRVVVRPFGSANKDSTI